MVRPIYLQDNFGKTLAAQEIVDQMTEGAEKIRNAHREIAQQRLEREERESTATLEERPGMKALKPESKHRHVALRKGRPERKRGGEQRGRKKEEGEPGQDLRRRREEDDHGKGDKLDITG